MIVRFSKPTFPLSKYVESIYAYIGSSNDIARKLIPDGKTDLMLNFSSNLYFFDEKKKKQEITKSLIQGIRREPLTFIFGKNINIIGVRFLPLGFSKLLNIPDKELQYKNKPVYAKDVMGNLLSEIEEKIFEESDADKKILIIENWLLELFNERKPSDILITGAVQAITQRKGTISVKEVCDNSVGIYKKIQRTFHDYLGKYKVTKQNRSREDVKRQKSAKEISRKDGKKQKLVIEFSNRRKKYFSQREKTQRLFSDK
jgi:hypothetical protein